MMKKLLVSLLSALLCISVVAKSRTDEEDVKYKLDNNITIYVFVYPLTYQISDGKATVYDYRWYEKLDSVIIPSEIQVLEHVYPVTSIRLTAFHHCKNLISINVSNNNLYYSSDEGILYDKNKTVLICAPGRKKGSVEIPNSVTCIEESAFRDCHYVTKHKDTFECDKNREVGV